MSAKYDKWLKEIQSNRRERLREAIAYKFGTKRGAMVEACAAIGRSPSQIRSLLYGRRGFGEELARDIECRLSLPIGWLDSRVVFDSATAPAEVTDRLERLMGAVADGRVSWLVFNSILDSALAVADASRERNAA